MRCFFRQKVRRLALPCLAVRSVFSARALAKLRAVELPAPKMCWPRRPELGVMRPPPPQPDDISVPPEGGLPVSFLDNPDADIWEDDKL